MSLRYRSRETGEIASRVIAHIQHFYGNLAHVTVDRDTTIDSLKIDSLDRIELVIHVEKTFNVMLNDPDWEQAHTVGRLIEIVEEAAR